MSAGWWFLQRRYVLLIKGRVIHVKVTFELLLAAGAEHYTGSPGTGSIFLEKVHCSEADTTLFECFSFSPLGIHSCDHSQDVSVRCTGRKL